MRKSLTKNSTTTDTNRVIFSSRNHIKTTQEIVLFPPVFCPTIGGRFKEAILLTKDKTFDLILMDMQMPIMDGIEATKAICESGCQTPVVAMTANVMQEHRDMFSDVGAVNFLEKPINKQNLQSILQSYLKEVVVDSGVSVSSGSQISEVMNKCGRLLIIDDDKKVLQAYESVFDANTDELLELAIGNNEPQIMRQEFEFALANQGEDGVKLAKKAMQTAEPFQVAFIDMRMPPGIDGLQTKVPPNRWTEIGGS